MKPVRVGKDEKQAEQKEFQLHTHESLIILKRKPEMWPLWIILVWMVNWIISLVLRTPCVRALCAQAFIHIEIRDIIGCYQESTSHHSNKSYNIQKYINKSKTHNSIYIEYKPKTNVGKARKKLATFDMFSKRLK